MQSEFLLIVLILEIQRALRVKAESLLELFIAPRKQKLLVAKADHFLS